MGNDLMARNIFFSGEYGLAVFGPGMRVHLPLFLLDADIGYHFDAPALQHPAAGKGLS